MAEWILVGKKARRSRAGAACAPRRYGREVVTADVGDTMETSAASISVEQRQAKLDQVQRIAAALKDDAMLADAIRMLSSRFGPARGVDGEHATADGDACIQAIHVVGYGLGSFCTSANAIHQLAFVVALADELRGVSGMPRSDVLVQIYDPVMNEVDKAIARHFDVKTIERNECGKHAIAAKTVFFMPHCDQALYENVLASNWGPQLGDLLIIGNSFEGYSDRLIDAASRANSVLVMLRPYLVETRLQWSLPRAHADFDLYERAFNDTSLHLFPSHLIQQALDNEALDQLVQRIASSTKARI